MTVIYADLLLGFNFILDLTLLQTTAWMRGIRPIRWKMFIAAGIGTLYASILFMPTFPILYTILGKVGVSIAMLLIAFGFHNVGYMLRNVGVFYFVAFTLAGGAFGIQYLWHDASQWALYESARSLWKDPQLQMGAAFLVCALAASVALLRTVWKAKHKQEIVTNCIVRLEIGIGDTKVTCSGLIDTGNQLSDPLSGAPVVVAESGLWKDLLPEEWINNLQRAQSGDVWQWIGEHHNELRIDESRLRIIPYRGVNHSSTMQWMIGIKPDYIRIEQAEHVYLCTKVIIGLDGGVLSHDGRYQVIVHPDLLQSTNRTTIMHGGDKSSGEAEASSTSKAS
ncbi:sigma-E processing peptidase SpoIIGA [Paenibacillus sp. 481]|uniref:sigma-E processing peptidase SpoIIGA n=1 Tax=Paenibacillus sp. 481 TaxID=2835869 RepID=UPI001E441FF5|nr:sigma-E processing peptidase SpoIIGA [Paenibacillus sp. 481]UHA74118.1 sigma-E processing peptidase SpoIIGA [Paenibacillus sp. 481]